MVLQAMIDKLTGTRQCYGLEMNVQKTEDNNLKATNPSTDYDRSKTTGECGIFQIFWVA